MANTSGSGTYGARKKASSDRVKQDLEKRRERKQQRHENNDAQESEDTEPATWEQLDGLYHDCRELLKRPFALVPLLRNKSIINNVSDIDRLTKNAKVLHKDLDEFVQQLDEIREQHQGRTGVIEDPDELMESITISEQYQRWMATYHSVVLPTVAELTDMISEADPSQQPTETQSNDQGDQANG